jgi:hypothetical protein
LREPREGKEGRKSYLVLNRSCADLHAELTELFANRTDIEVIVDRRRGKGGMIPIPLWQRRARSRGGYKPV